MPQQAIRFPDDLHAAIKAEAERRGKPHTFSSVLIEWAERGQDGVPAASSARVVAARTESNGAAPAAGDTVTIGHGQAPPRVVDRGSPSPSLARFAGGVSKRKAKR